VRGDITFEKQVGNEGEKKLPSVIKGINAGEGGGRG